MIYKSYSLEIKDVSPKEGIITGYFSAFGMKDSDGDTILPGSFKRSIEEWGPGQKERIKHLLNHDKKQPIARPLELKEDEYGLWYRSKVGTHALGVDFVKMAESGLITEHSIGFEDLTPDEQRKGVDGNNITHVKLWEGSSLTAWGANEFTPLTGIKEFSPAKMKLFEKFIRDTDATDETIEKCIEYIKILKQKEASVNLEMQLKTDREQLSLLILKHF
jgi:HK97 family phage prohead protease